jgi:dTDP-4-dehydrorhamnose reductase
MKLLIFGGTGLLGFDIIRYLSKKKKYKIFTTIRKLKAPTYLKKIRNIKIVNNINFYSIKKIKDIVNEISPNVVINCVGIIKQNIKKKYKIKEKKKILKINSLVPEIISRYCFNKNIRFVHFSTDCVFDGINNSKTGYKEYDKVNAKDLYGISKSKGELLSSSSIILRTSFIGIKNNNKNLISWFLRQKKAVVGYKNVYFNGLTTFEIAKILHKLILKNNKINGLFHLSGKKINKYKLLLIAKKIFKKKIVIRKNLSFILDRSLNSKKFQKTFNYKKKSWYKLISELKKFNKYYKTDL